MNKPSQITLNLTIEEVELTVNALAELPYKVTANLIPKIINQAKAAFTKPEQTESESSPSQEADAS